MHKILVVDDDTRLRNLLGKFLSDNSFAVELAKDAFEAAKILEKEKFDILVVDVMMPGLTGIEFTKEFRKNNDTPILILTAMAEVDDRIEGLESGADDYLAKPFEPKELLLRIKNILKRNSKPDKSSCNFGDFTFSLKEKRLKKGSDFIYITESEAAILEILCKNIAKKISRDDLSKKLGIDQRSIDVQITRLRKKIEVNPKEPHFLQTARGYGYILQK